MRGHTCKLANAKFHTDFRKYFFTQRVVTVWNSLAGHVGEAETLEVLKIRLETEQDTI